MGLAGEMQNLDGVGVRLEGRQAAEHGLVDPSRPLASAQDGDEVALGMKPQFFERLLLGNFSEATADGSAADADLGLGEMAAALLKADEHLVRPGGKELRGAAWDGVGLVKEIGNTAAPGRSH